RSGAALTMQRAAGHAAINVNSGSHEIASLNLASSTDVSVNSGSSLSITSALSASPAASLTKNGGGVMVAPNASANALTINAGAVRVTVNGGNSGVTYVKSLSIAPAAALDLNDNDLVVEYGTNPSPFSAVRDAVFSR